MAPTWSEKHIGHCTLKLINLIINVTDVNITNLVLPFQISQ